MGRGIIPNAVHHICSRMSEVTEENDIQYTVKMSFMEVYNEKIHDLLEDPSKDLPVRETLQRTFHVPDLKKVSIEHPKKAFKLIECADSNRCKASTSQNEQSSRSHVIMTIYIDKK